jgi:hypothetical protein
MRINRLPLLPLLALLGCAEPPPPPSAPLVNGPACQDHRAGFPALLGRSEMAVRQALAGLPGIIQIRAAGPNAPMTRDFRPQRASLLVVDGQVLRIDCG